MKKLVLPNFHQKADLKDFEPLVMDQLSFSIFATSDPSLNLTNRFYWKRNNFKVFKYFSFKY